MKKLNKLVTAPFAAVSAGLVGLTVGTGANAIDLSTAISDVTAAKADLEDFGAVVIALVVAVVVIAFIRKAVSSV